MSVEINPAVAQSPAAFTQIAAESDLRLLENSNKSKIKTMIWWSHARAFNLAWLRRVYETYPRRVSLLELLVFFGILIAYLWVVPFWFWGVYSLNIPLPDSLSKFFYRVWMDKNVIRAFLIAFLACLIPLGIYMRRFPLREMGIRADNLWISTRECLYVLLFILLFAAALVITFRHNLSLDRYFARQQETSRHLLSDIFVGLISGIAQQFLLQSFLLQRTLKIFKNQWAAILCSSILFSLIHTPNINLMVITVVFGTMCSFLFLRNRNIVPIGILHGIAQQGLRILFSSVIVSGSYLSGGGYLRYDLSVGPPKGYPEYLAELKYEGSLPLTASASGGAILVPVSVTNKSTRTWSSTNEKFVVSVGYRVVDQKGNLMPLDSRPTPFDKPIAPGDSETVKLMVSAPSERGDYSLEVDIVHPSPNWKDVIWFKRKGSKTILIPFSVR